MAAYLEDFLYWNMCKQFTHKGLKQDIFCSLQLLSPFKCRGKKSKFTTPSSMGALHSQVAGT